MTSHGLMNLAKLDQETHTYTTDPEGLPVRTCVTHIMQLAGIVKPYPKEAQANVEHARELGTLTHGWSRYLDHLYANKIKQQEIADELRDAEILPYVLAWGRYLIECEPEWEYVEQSFHRDDIGGTPDRIGTFLEDDKRIRAIVDIKTQRQPATYWGIQLSAYQWITNLNYELYVIWLGRDGTWKPMHYNENRKVWEAAVTVAKWQML